MNLPRVKIGDPYDPATQLGPLAMERQRERVEYYIARGKEEGADLAHGGGRPANLNRGWFIEPTLFANVDARAVIAQEEIFGPVVSVIPAASEDDAVANRQRHGIRAQQRRVHTGRKARLSVRPPSARGHGWA